MKFKTIEVKQEFKPVALAVVVESYGDLHRIANGLGTVGSDLIKGIREQARALLSELQDENIEGSYAEHEAKCEALDKSRCVGAWCPGCAECCPDVDPAENEVMLQAKGQGKYPPEGIQ